MMSLFIHSCTAGHALKLGILMTAICAVVVASVGASAADDAFPLRSIVKVYAVASPPNFHEPWQNYPDTQGTGSGCVIEGGRILTSAHVVSNQTFIMVRRQGDPKKYVAKLLVSGHDCDLALLTVDDPEFFRGAAPFEIGELPRLRDTVTVLGYPVGGDNISITSGVVSRIEPTLYTHTGRWLLSVQIDAAINPGNSGGPVIQDGKLVGVAFQGIQTGDNIGYMVPPPIIRHFLDDVKDGAYNGFPDLDINFVGMESPAMRRWAKMSDGQSGLLITHVGPQQAALESGFKVDDVIMAIDGTAVANDATIPFRASENLFFGILIWNKHVGDSATFSVLRGGQKIELVQKLEMDRKLVPHRMFGKLPSYFIFGGLLFIPLTQNYIDAWGNIAKAPRPIVSYLDDGEITPERDQVVVLSKILADDISIGYQNNGCKIVAKINGTTVRNLRHLVELIESAKSEFLVVDLENHDKIVLDAGKAREATASILARYRISADRSADVAKP